MIRSLRWKFIVIAMVSLLGTMAVLCTAIGVGNHYVTAHRVDRAIFLLHQNGGSFRLQDTHTDPYNFNFQVTPETPFETRYFIVELTAQKEIKGVELEHIAALDRRTVVETVSQIVDSGKNQGYLGHYRFGVFPREDGGSTVIVLDCFLQLQAANNMLRVIIAVFLVCATAVFFLLLCLSKRAIRPFVDNLERQRQFVTDASHELKTPLAILSADIGLLEDSYGTDKWLESARVQVLRLDKLIKNLVELARTEETVKEEIIVCFSVSDIAQASVDAFLPLAKAAGKTLTWEVAEQVTMKGIQDNFFRLFSILLDNAVKYCDSGGRIHLSVVQRGRNIYISVSNPCRDVEVAQLPRYFDRFYRADSSRARSTGGYGIGLSTAKAIVTRHKGRITSSYADGVITFRARIPQQNQ